MLISFKSRAHNSTTCSVGLLVRQSIRPSVDNTLLFRCLRAFLTLCPKNVSRHCVPTLCPYIVSLYCVPTLCPDIVSQHCVPTLCPSSVSQYCVPTLCPNIVSRHCFPTLCHEYHESGTRLIGVGLVFLQVLSEIKMRGLFPASSTKIYSQTRMGNGCLCPHIALGPFIQKIN